MKEDMFLHHFICFNLKKIVLNTEDVSFIIASCFGKVVVSFFLVLNCFSC